MVASTDSPTLRRKAASEAKPGPAAQPRTTATTSSSSGVLKRSNTPANKLAPPVAKGKPLIAYHSSKGVDDFVRQLAAATPLQLVEIERSGVPGGFLKDLSRRMEIPAGRVFVMLGVPKATAEKKAATGEVLSGSGGQAAIGIAKLLGIAQGIVANSTAAEAKGFDSAKWLGRWLERPQPALGGRRPGDLVDTPTGIEVVAKLLGAIESGAYQ
jgi:putative toxin-antitoxin system antitoxin component (TIGR02293 family)